MEKKERRKALFSIFFVASLDNFGFGIVFILFAPLILDPTYGMVNPNLSLATKNVLLGLLFACFPLTQLFGAPLIGDFADRFGRKRSFYLTIIGTTLGYICSAIAIILYNFAFLLISRLITGFFAGNLSLCLAGIADLSADEKSRSKQYGIITVVWGVSWPLAMITGGYLSDTHISPYFTPDIPFWLTTALSLFSLLFIHLFFHETHFVAKKENKMHLLHGITNIIASLKIKALRIYFFSILFWTLGWGLSVQWYGAYTIERYRISQILVAWGLILQGLFWVIGGSIANPLLLKAFTIRTTALIGLLFTALFLFLSSLFDTFFLFSLFFWISAIGSAFGLSNLLSVTSFHASSDIHGKIMGLSQSMMSLGWFLVPFMAILFGNLAIEIFYSISGLSLLLSFASLFFAPFLNKRKND